MACSAGGTVNRAKALAGTYALIFHLTEGVECEAGRLGRLALPPGYYIYLGSAFGPGGVRARTEHHRHVAQRPHWHLDYLRPHMELLEIWASYDPQRREHLWAETMAAMRGARLPVPGFGSSDCRCPAHLVRLGYKPSLAGFRRRLKKQEPGHAPVRCVLP